MHCLLSDWGRWAKETAEKVNNGFLKQNHLLMPFREKLPTK